MASAPGNDSTSDAASDAATGSTNTAGANKAGAKKAGAKKAGAKKAGAKKAGAKKAGAKKAGAKKAGAKKAGAKKAGAKKAGAKKAAAKKAAGARAAGQGVAGAGAASMRAGAGRKGSPAKRAAARKHARRLAVREDESPWTRAELGEVRRELQADSKRLQAEIAVADRDVQTLMRDNGDGAGNDQADVGSNTFERDHEMAIVAQHREMLEQVERALGRIKDGSYGVCERCGNPIGKMRLMAFPRATLCVPCKQREERR